MGQAGRSAPPLAYWCFSYEPEGRGGEGRGGEGRGGEEGVDVKEGCECKGVRGGVCWDRVTHLTNWSVGAVAHRLLQYMQCSLRAQDGVQWRGQAEAC